MGRTIRSTTAVVWMLAAAGVHFQKFDELRATYKCDRSVALKAHETEIEGRAAYNPYSIHSIFSANSRRL